MPVAWITGVQRASSVFTQSPSSSGVPGVAATPSSADALRDWVKAEVTRWTPVIQNAGIRAD